MEQRWAPQKEHRWERLLALAQGEALGLALGAAALWVLLKVLLKASRSALRSAWCCGWCRRGAEIEIGEIILDF